MPVTRAHLGDRVRVGPVSWTVLWPARVVHAGSEPNNASTVLLVRVHGMSLLLTGDVEPEAQRVLLARGGLGRVDVLKVAHHGSAYQDPALLATARPRVALVSVGEDNDYGHPAPSDAGRPASKRAPSSGAPTGTARCWSPAPDGRSGWSPAAGSVAPMADLPPPVTLVTGPEDLLRDRAVAEVLVQARAADPAVQVHDLSVVGLEPGRVTGLASPSLFGELSVIVVRDVAEAAEAVTAELKEHATAPQEGVVLVLVHHGGVKGKALLDAVKKAGAAVVECKPVKWESDKVSFVQAEFGRAHRRISHDAASALVDALGSDLRELANACSQLIADTQGTVDAAVVERYHAGRVEVSGFKVADAAVEGRHDEALRLLRHALATGTDPVPINAAFASGLRNLARVGGSARTVRPDDIARDLGIAPFQVRKARGQLSGWTGEGVAQAIAAVAVADEQIKGAGTDPVFALEQAIGAIVAARSRRD